MKTIKTKIDGRDYYLYYSAETMFELDDLFDGQNAAEAISAGGREGFEAALQAAAIMAEQGELARRSMGYDAGDIPSVDRLRTAVQPADLVTLRQAVIDAMCLGLNQTVDSTANVVDLGLAETEKKTN